MCYNQQDRFLDNTPGVETLYLASLETKTGKTLLAAALGQRLAARGMRVGYCKPVASEGDGDGSIVRRALGLAEGTGSASFVLAERALDSQLTEEERQRVLSCLEESGREKDVLLVEGSCGLAPGDSSTREVVEMLGARVLLLLWYTEELDLAVAARAAADLRGSLAGVLVNGVPPLRLRHAGETLVPQLTERGLPVVGILPQDRLLHAATIREIAAHLGGQILFFPDKADELVEHIMIGALALDGGLYYFSQQENKLVITRWDRPDMQAAALETSTKGFILTGGQGPIPYIQARIEEAEVPIVVVQEGTIATASRLDGFFSRGALYPQKIERAGELLETHMDALVQMVSGGG